MGPLGPFDVYPKVVPLLCYFNYKIFLVPLTVHLLFNLIRTFFCTSNKGEGRFSHPPVPVTLLHSPANDLGPP